VCRARVPGRGKKATALDSDVVRAACERAPEGASEGGRKPRRVVRGSAVSRAGEGREGSDRSAIGGSRVNAARRSLESLPDDDEQEQCVPNTVRASSEHYRSSVLAVFGFLERNLEPIL